MTNPTGPEQMIAEARLKHRVTEQDRFADYCDYCDYCESESLWPCLTIRLANALEEQQKVISAAAQPAVAMVCGSCVTPSGSTTRWLSEN